MLYIDFLVSCKVKRMTDKEKIYRSFRELKQCGYIAKPKVENPAREMFPYSSYDLVHKKDARFIYYLKDFEDLFDDDDALTAPMPIYFGGRLMDAMVIFHTYGLECRVEEAAIGLLSVSPRNLVWI